MRGSRRQARATVRRARGILLDVSLDGPRQEGCVLLRPDGDLRHDPLVVPWPLEDQVVLTAVVTKVLEYVEPGPPANPTWVRWMNELHRVMRPKGKVYLSGVWGGDEGRWAWEADPCHRIRVTSPMLDHLDPRTDRYARYRPRPWHVHSVTRVPWHGGVIAYNAILEAQPC